MDFSLSSSAFSYQLFFVIAFALSYLIIILFLNRDNRLNSKYLTASTLVFLAFVIGTKLVSVADYYFFQREAGNLFVWSQMAVGGIILSSLALLLVTRFLKLKREYIDYFAVAVIAGLAIQKPGCLLGGCCIGTEAGVISVSYADGIAHNALPVYEIIAYLLVLVLLFRSKVIKLKAGSKYFIAVALFALVQLVTEFYRTEQFTIALAEFYMGLKFIQWLYIVLLLSSLIALLFNQALSTEHKTSAKFNKTIIWRVVIILFTTIFILLLTNNILYRIEIYAINIALIPALSYNVIRVYQHFTIPKYRIATLLLSTLPLFLMSQTVIPNDTIKYSYHSLGLGFKMGDAINHIVNDPDPDDCSGPIYPRTFDHSFSLFGLGYSYSKVEKKGKMHNKIEYGVDASIGKHTESFFDGALETVSEYNIYDINPYFKVDTRWVGLKFGGHVGNLSRFLTRERYEINSYPLSGAKQTGVVPQVSVRVGPVQYLFIEYNYANQFVSALPEMPQDIAIGTGFTYDNGFYLKVGGTISSENSIFLSTYVPITHNIAIESLFRFKNGNTFTLGGHYKFGKSMLDKSKAGKLY